VSAIACFLIFAFFGFVFILLSLRKNTTKKDKNYCVRMAVVYFAVGTLFSVQVGTLHAERAKLSSIKSHIQSNS